MTLTSAMLRCVTARLRECSCAFHRPLSVKILASAGARARSSDSRVDSRVKSAVMRCPVFAALSAILLASCSSTISASSSMLSLAKNWVSWVATSSLVYCLFGQRCLETR